MILDARPYVELKIKELRDRTSKLDVKPFLAIIKVGNDPASERYVKNKLKRCEEVGVEAVLYSFDSDVDEETVAAKIAQLNVDDCVTGILLQLPLPAHLNEHYLTNRIRADKDVDGFTELNTGRLSLGAHGNIPCTPKGVINLLDFYDIPIAGKDVLIINRSNIVGKPLAQLFLERDATVTVAHSKTNNLKEKIKNADIVVTGVGIPKFLHDSDFKDGTVIIDISINFVNGKMCGDVDKDHVSFLASRCDITPVPFGVGQTTVISLIDNLIEIVEK